MLFLFNPFGEQVMRRFAQAVPQHAASGDGRNRRVVYRRCKLLGPFREVGRFAIEPIELPSRRHEAVVITTRHGGG
jgi:hypothetical protein